MNTADIPPVSALLLWSLTLLVSNTQANEAAPLPPLADVHLHYNWDQEGVTEPEEAVAALRREGVVLAVVSGTPPELALALREAGGDWIVPLYRPYLEGGRRHSWFNDPRVLPAARKALQSGRYAGIGEFHLIAGRGPGPKNPVLHGLIRLGIEFRVPLLVHIETSSHKYFLPLCRQYPRARFLLAHAGGLLDAREIGMLLSACTNVWTEFSARDGWRYIHSPIVNENGELLADWLALIRKYPDRFMIGSDPVWPIENLHSWDQPDTGWERLGEYLDFHRRWLERLPPALERRLRLDNARDFFDHGGRVVSE